MSFAEGFRSGFGLISDVQDRQFQRERLDEQARQADLDRNSLAEYREGQLEIGRKRNEIDGKKAGNETLRLTNEQLRLNNQKTQLGLEQTRINADAGLKGAQANTLTDELEAKKARRGQRETNAAAAAQVQTFVDLAEQVRTGEVAFDADTQARLADMAASTQGTLMDLNYVTQPNVQFQAGRLQETLDLIASGKAEQIDETALRDTFNVVFHSNNMAGVGQEVTSETHPHAGSFADKGYVVVSKQVSNVGLDNNSLGLTVDVLIENPETGETFTYEAPMTVGRESGSEKAFMSVEEAVQAASGFYQYAKAMAPYRGVLNQINARGYDLVEGRKDGDFLQLVAGDIKAAELDGARNPELSSPIKGMTMAEFSANKGLMRAHYSANRAGSYQPVEAALAGDQTYNALKNQNVITRLERFNEGKPLSRAKVLEAAQYLSIDENGNAVIDNDEDWNRWKNNTFRRASRFRTPSEELAMTNSFNAID